LVIETEIGKNIYGLVERLFPICRSLTGDGVRQTLAVLKEEIIQLKIHEIASGTKCFDWEVPYEWNIREAFILTPDGNKIAEFKKNNLHVVGYSDPVDKIISLVELQEHLYSLPDQPDAIPYVTSYYENRWGFCLSDKQRQDLKPGNYRVYIDSTLATGHLTYGELIIPGEKETEVLLSANICHPSLANNELSGPTVTTYIAKWLLGLKRRKHTYRIIFIPETIGAIAYLSRHLKQLQQNIIAGFTVTCIGDDHAYSYVPSRAGDTLADRVALHVLKHTDPNFIKYTFLDRGSDERQYCSPGIDLPVASVMRSKYGAYSEYHTSLDNLDFISPAGLYGGYEALRRCLLCLEHNEKLKAVVLGEPQLGKRGLYRTLGVKGITTQDVTMKHLLAYSDGNQDLLTTAEKIGVPMCSLLELIKVLKEEGLLTSFE